MINQSLIASLVIPPPQYRSRLVCRLVLGVSSSPSRGGRLARRLVVFFLRLAAGGCCLLAMPFRCDMVRMVICFIGIAFVVIVHRVGRCVIFAAAGGSARLVERGVRLVAAGAVFLV